MSPFPLLSNGPHEDLSPADRLFEPFIGSWDLDITWYGHGAVTRRAKGEWHFAWVLEGRAIQDVWVVPPRAATRNRRAVRVRNEHPVPGSGMRRVAVDVARPDAAGGEGLPGSPRGR